ncbi:hypothetical protein [Gordonibacter urolithinfaciens]|uniref:hypothetical protein n=1 Tax=Gordonibacter urolithinfaciens TaxID=1335613 RepID=UPI000F4C22DC|nr:hypothetical protein [Gordonibacter urolithinfaciens]ROT91271.1 hypothetical protein DMP13_07150 [Gordonibacter urolithinfaciens]GKG89914.1 hypothetical protein CE91St32_09560 [Gordonibacter pamelaeae]
MRAARLLAAVLVLVLVKDDRKVAALRAEEDRKNLAEAGVIPGMPEEPERTPAPAPGAAAPIEA